MANGEREREFILAKRHSIFQTIKKITLWEALSQGVLDERLDLICSLGSVSVETQFAHVLIQGGNRGHDCDCDRVAVSISCMLAAERRGAWRKCSGCWPSMRNLAWQLYMCRHLCEAGLLSTELILAGYTTRRMIKKAVVLTCVSCASNLSLGRSIFLAPSQGSMPL